MHCITDEADDAGKLSDNRHVKVIARTYRALTLIRPHVWRFKVAYGSTGWRYSWQ